MRVGSNLRCFVFAIVLLSSLCLLFQPSHAQTERVALDATWKFLSPLGIAEDPGDANANFDTTWFTAGFNDNAWDTGPGPFEYGGVNALTNLNPTPLTDPGSGDRYTNYFRHRFNTTATLSNLGLDILADDGAVIYLDGQEVLRLNCCDTPEDDYLSFASAVGNEGAFRVVRLDPGLTIRPGQHILAASLHQQSTTSSDLGFGLRLLSDLPAPPTGGIRITEGIDTLLAEAGQQGPDAPHGDLPEWEWDGSDGGGQNHGLIWFNIPEDILDNFGNGAATLQLTVTNEGNSGDVHRVTADWLSIPGGGNDITWSTIPPIGQGLFPGENVEELPTISTGDITVGQVLELDVSEDVRAWASGTPNYGWGFLPTGTNGSGIDSFEGFEPPVLILFPEKTVTPGDFDNDGDLDVADVNALIGAIPSGPAATFDVTGDGKVDQADLNKWVNDLRKTWIGDSNLDGEFSTGDLVQIFQRGKFERNVDAGWDDGDWTGDKRFGTGDLVAAFQAGGFERGPRAAAAAVPEPSCFALLFAGFVPWMLRGRKRITPVR